jgi:hypothetical protein
MRCPWEPGTPVRPQLSPCPGSSGRLSGGLSRTHRDRVGPVLRYRDSGTGRPTPRQSRPGPCGAAAVTSRGAPQRTWHRPWLRRSRAPAPPLPLWRPARRRRGDRGWRRCGAAPCVRSPDGRPRGSAGCRVRAGTRCRGSHPPRPGAGCPGGSGGGLVSAWASAGSTVTIVGTTKAPVPATAAFRMKSRRPVAPPGFWRTCVVGGARHSPPPRTPHRGHESRTSRDRVECPSVTCGG